MATSVDVTNKNIVIVGATGNTGLQLVEQALAFNYKVIAPVRNPDKLAHIKHENLQVVKCDLMNSSELAKHLGGCVAVLSALGQRGLQISAMTFYEDSMKSIVDAMRNAKVKRLVCMTSFYTKYQPALYPFIFKTVIRLMIGRHLDSMFIMEQYLEKECQDIDYTIVRPPRLLDEPIIEKPVKVQENDYFFPDQSTGNRIPRANVARFMLDVLKDEKYIHQGVAIDIAKT
ncbi:unnamed protein product [Rotaria magnacalcarata]|uniref:NAD(P)-binding domain-containing protein n=1 Tax=Rotaria magnacalcarata TaxID=392030 RepID=A0A816MZQ7_9BILA|nr:unnamed protein product [Rotaria magnacalcarata]CAF1460954.1 unnamed protein product [Rotaria magnacalcarata]CAF2009732.1 unnamed protein product [Rotaria magnacalcarata]CAF2019659.1 unnamed protein product [Rotaria magnacalcarata]CAF2133989.1 unnamed protein product [Rotaria magnacalcarata]